MSARQPKLPDEAIFHEERVHDGQYRLMRDVSADVRRQTRKFVSIVLCDPLPCDPDAAEGGRPRASLRRAVERAITLPATQGN